MLTWFLYILFWVFMAFTPFLLIGSGVYAGFYMKRRWFYPALGYFVCLIVYNRIFMHTYLCVIETFMPILMELFKTVWIVLLVISYVIMSVIAIMRRKGKGWINILVSISLIAVTVFAFRMAFVELRADWREKYCTTYYKYPDHIIREMDWDSIQKWYGPFDWKTSPLFYEYWGGYYAYTDEQGNDWYYTIYFLEGDVEDIRMEIH